MLDVKEQFHIFLANSFNLISVWRWVPFQCCLNKDSPFTSLFNWVTSSPSTSEKYLQNLELSIQKCLFPSLGGWKQNTSIRLQSRIGIVFKELTTMTHFSLISEQFTLKSLINYISISPNFPDCELWSSLISFQRFIKSDHCHIVTHLQQS